MTGVSRSQSRKLYSWWWDSHISPKNSKWLQDNLTDMDSKVKAMIKLIEEDADSFSRRAELYFKKRPELLELVEEFYRAYRALAERYDSATVELRQAHRSIVEPQTPENPHPIKFLLDSDQLTAESGESVRYKEVTSFNNLSSVEASVFEKILVEIQAEKEDLAQKFHENLQKLFALEREITDVGGLDEQSSRSEVEIKVLRETMKRMESERDAHLEQYSKCLNDEKEACYDRYSQSLEMISVLQDKISISQENGRLLVDHKKQAEAELEELRSAVSKLNEEKQLTDLQYEICLRKVSQLEAEVSSGQDAVKRLKSVEERNDLLMSSNESLRTEIEALNHKITAKDQEVLRKERDVNEIQTLLRDEKKRLSVAESSLDALRKLHEKSEEAQEAITSELEKRLQIITCMSSSSGATIQELRSEVTNLIEMKTKLESDLTYQLEQSNAFGEETSYLKNEIAILNRKYQEVLEQQKSKESNMASMYRKESDDKMKELQESCRVLRGENSDHVAEKGILLSQIQMMLDNMQKISEKNALSEHSLARANIEVENLRSKTASLEEICQTLKDEKTSLLRERNNLLEQLQNVGLRMGHLEARFAKLEEKCNDLDTDKGFQTVSHVRMTDLEKQVDMLREERMMNKKEFEQEITRAVDAEIEIKVLQKFIEDLEQKNVTLLFECQKHVESTKLSKKLIAEFETENIEQQAEIEFLLDEIEKLRTGIRQIFKALQFNSDALQGESFDCIDTLTQSLQEIDDERQLLLVEQLVLLTLFEQMGLQAEDYSSLQGEKSNLEKANEQMLMDLRTREEKELLLLSQMKNLEDDNANLAEQNLNLLRSLSVLVGFESLGIQKMDVLGNLQAEAEKRVIDSSITDKRNVELLLLKLTDKVMKQQLEIENLCRANGDMKSKMKENVLNGESLILELEETGNEVEFWEAEASSFFFDLQASSVREIFLDDKVHELAAVCSHLEAKNKAATVKIEHLRDRIVVLENEIAGLEVQQSPYVPPISFLRNNIEFNETPSLVSNHRTLDYKMFPQTPKSEHDGDGFTEDEGTSVTDRFDGQLEDSGRREVIKAAMIGEEDQLRAAKVTATADADQKELQIRSFGRRYSSQIWRHNFIYQDNDFEPVDLRSKDIPLDQASDCSSLDSQTLEPWGTAAQIPKKKGVVLSRNRSRRNRSKSGKNRKWSFIVEPQIDRLQVPRTSAEELREEFQDKMILERLESDAKRLISSELVVQELTKKLEAKKKGKKVNTAEVEMIKTRLLEAEEAILHLFGSTNQLARDIQTIHPAEKSSVSMEKDQASGREGIAERAYKGSEMIGCIQFEVESIQSTVAEITGGKIKKGKSKFPGRTILLKNFLNSGDVGGKKRNGACLCGHRRPSTADD